MRPLKSPIIHTHSHAHHFISWLESSQVPRERRNIASAVKPTDLSATATRDSSSNLELLENHLQVLRSMPVNLSMNSSTTTANNTTPSGSAEHLGSKCGSMGSASAEVRGGVCSSGGWDGGVGMAPLALVKSESQMSNTELLKSCCGGSYKADPSELIRMDYNQQSRCDLSYLAHLKEDERSPPDSTYDDSCCDDKEVPVPHLYTLYFIYVELLLKCW